MCSHPQTRGSQHISPVQDEWSLLQALLPISSPSQGVLAHNPKSFAAPRMSLGLGTPSQRAVGMGAWLTDTGGTQFSSFVSAAVPRLPWRVVGSRQLPPARGALVLSPGGGSVLHRGVHSPGGHGQPQASPLHQPSGSIGFGVDPGVGAGPDPGVSPGLGVCPSPGVSAGPYPSVSPGTGPDVSLGPDPGVSPGPGSARPVARPSPSPSPSAAPPRPGPVPARRAAVAAGQRSAWPRCAALRPQPQRRPRPAPMFPAPPLPAAPRPPRAAHKRGPAPARPRPPLCAAGRRAPRPWLRTS